MKAMVKSLTASVTVLSSKISTIGTSGGGGGGGGGGGRSATPKNIDLACTFA